MARRAITHEDFDTAMPEEDEDEGVANAEGTLSAGDRELLGATTEEDFGAAEVDDGLAAVNTGGRTVVGEGTVDASGDVAIKVPVAVVFNDAPASAAAVGLKVAAFRWTLPGPVLILDAVSVRETVIGLPDRSGMGDKESLASGWISTSSIFKDLRPICIL